MNQFFQKLRARWIWIGAAALLCLLLIGLYFLLRGTPTPDYKTAKVEKGAIVATVAAAGNLSAVVSVQVGSQVSGLIKDIYVDYNSEVKKGQLIARIDPESFEYKVRQAQADLDAARSQVLLQQAEVARQEVNLANAKRDYDRNLQLFAKNFISAAARDTAQATYQALVQQVKSARAQAAVSAAGIKQKEAALSQTKVDLAHTEIRAPVNGIVIKRSVEKGQTVAASLQAPELFIIAENLEDMQVDTAVDEAEIGRIRDQQKATFTVDAFPGRTFEGMVKQIRKAAQTTSNVVTYTVEVTAPNPNKELFPGMTANVRIITETREDVLRVPNAALRFKPVGASAPAVADASAKGGANQFKAQRERLEKELALNDEQKAKLDTIFTALREKMAGARNAQEADRKKLIERVRNEMRDQVAAILTPEQKQKYEEINAESASRRAGSTTNGRLYVLDNGKPREMAVRVGTTDGTMSEVMAADLKEGMEIIVGTVQPHAGSSKPAAPTGPRMF